MDTFSAIRGALYGADLVPAAKIWPVLTVRLIVTSPLLSATPDLDLADRHRWPTPQIVTETSFPGVAPLILIVAV